MGKKSTERMYGEERRGKMPFYFHGGNRIREREKKEGERGREECYRGEGTVYLGLIEGSTVHVRIEYT